MIDTSKLNKNSILAVIPARGGSKRLPRKNILNLRGRPLLEYSLLAAQNCNLITDVVVTSEDLEICNIASNAGATVIKRPMELAGDTVSNEHVIKHAIEAFTKNHYFPEFVVLLQPTSPLRTAEHLQQCIALFLRSAMKSALSVCKVEHHPGKCMRINQNTVEPYTNLDDVEKRTQELEDVFRQNGAIYILRTIDFLNELKFYQPPCLPYVMNTEESIDIDSFMDLQFCEFLLSNHENLFRINEYVS